MVSIRRVKWAVLLAAFVSSVYFMMYHLLLPPGRDNSAPPGLEMSLNRKSNPCTPHLPLVDTAGHLVFCDGKHPHHEHEQALLQSRGNQLCPLHHQCIHSPDLTYALCCETAVVHQHGLGRVGSRPLVANRRDAEPPIYVTLFSDKSSLIGMVAAVNSIQRNSKAPVKFLLVTNQQTHPYLKKWIEETELKSINYNITVFNEEWVRDKINIHGTRQELSSPLNFGRYYLPRLFPHLHGRLVYVDTDTIVQGDISELNNSRLMPGHPAAFSDDCTGSFAQSRLKQSNFAHYVNLLNPEVRALTIKPTKCSFNTGVFVADMTAWKQQNITEKLEFWLNLNRKVNDVYSIKSGDSASQPPMMLAFHDKYSIIDPLWNVQYIGVTRYSGQFLREAKLLHWNGRFKPWGRKAMASELWDKYFIQDPSKNIWPIRKPKNLVN